MQNNLQHGSRKTWDEYFKVLQRRRRWIAGLFFAGWFLVWASAWILPSEFRSEALILVEQQTVPKDLVTPNVNSDLQDRIQTMTQEVMSRTQLQRIIDEHNLYWKKKARLSPDELIEKMRNDIQIELVRSSQTSSRQESTAFKISYVAPSAKLSQDITAQLTSLFIDENLRTRQQRSEDTTSFLENQLSEAKKSLQDQESKIQMFKSQYGGQLPSQSGLNGGSLSAMQGRLQSLNESLNQAEQQQISLESLSAQYHAIHNHGTDDGLAKMKAELADLRAKYTENHPDVKRLKQQIAAIESKNASATGNDQKASEPSPGSYADLAEMAPVIQIDNQLRSNKLDVESKRRQIKALESQIAGFQGRLMTAPLREQQLAELTRDYDQSRTYYESLLNKKNQSELATNLERRQQGEQFRLLDPASLPTKPSFPDRMKMSLWGLLVGILFAGAAVAISEAVDDKVYNEKELKEIVSARVLASIPPMPTAAEQQLHAKRSRQEYLVSAAALAVIVLAFLISFYRG